MIPKINHKYRVKICGGESIAECVDYDLNSKGDLIYLFVLEGQEDGWDVIYESEVIEET